MIEQYIYSRSKKKFTNARGEKINLGFGFMAATPGLDEGLKSELLLFCSQYRNKDVADGAGQLVPLYCKSSLRGGRGAVLQSNCYMVIEQRGTHVAHGFVLPPDSPVLVQPRDWFGAEFWQKDPNLASPEGESGGGILLDGLDRLPGRPFVLRPLAVVMEQAGLNEESFAALLRACFDAVGSQRQVKIAFDFQAPDARELQSQLLCWIYQCLPFSMRREMGFDAVCSEGTSARQYQLTLVPQDRVQITGKKAYIRQGSLVSVGSDFLFAQGQLFHGAAPDRKEWLTSQGLFVRWLNSLVHQLWNGGQSTEALLTRLDAVYALLDRLMQGTPREKHCDAALYDALCWHYLADGNGTAAGMPHIPAVDDTVEYTSQEVRRCQLVLLQLSLQDDQSGEELGLSVLADLEENRPAWDAAQRQEALELLAIAAQGPKKTADAAVWMAVDLLAEELAEGKQAPGAVWDKYRQAFPASVHAFLAEHGLLGPYAPQRSQPERRQRVLDSWLRGWLGGCHSAAQLAQGCCQALGQLPPLSEQGFAALGQALLGYVKGWTQRTACSVDAGELRTLVDWLLRLENTARDRQLEPVGQMLLDWAANRYPLCNPAASLQELELLWKIFQPGIKNPKIQACWQQLLDQRSDQLAGHRAGEGFGADLCQQNTLDRLRQLDRDMAGLPGAQQAMQKLYHAALQTLATSPAAFMTGEWFSRQAAALQNLVPAQDRRVLDIWQALGAFAMAPRQDQPAMTQAWAKLDDSQRQVFRKLLPYLYLAGNLPRLSTGFILLLLRMRQQNNPEALLLQMTAQQGWQGVEQLVDWAWKYQHPMMLEEKPTTDLVYLLELLAGCGELWDRLEQRADKENRSCLLQLMRRCRQMEKQGDLDCETAGHLLQEMLRQLERLHHSKKWFNRKKYQKEFLRQQGSAKEKKIWRG